VPKTYEDSEYTQHIIRGNACRLLVTILITSEKATFEIETNQSHSTTHHSNMNVSFTTALFFAAASSLLDTNQAFTIFPSFVPRAISSSKLFLSSTRISKDYQAASGMNEQHIPTLIDKLTPGNFAESLEMMEPFLMNECLENEYQEFMDMLRSKSSVIGKDVPRGYAPPHFVTSDTSEEDTKMPSTFVAGSGMNGRHISILIDNLSPENFAESLEVMEPLLTNECVGKECDLYMEMLHQKSSSIGMQVPEGYAPTHH